MNIVLYGIGKGLQYAKKCLNSDVKILAYSDSFSDLHIYCGMPFVKPKELRFLEYDYILVTIIDRKIALETVERLSRDFFLDADKIIPFFCCCNTEIYRSKLSANNIENTKMLVLGNSHAFYGINEELFENQCINLSSPGQDLYYDSYILEKAMQCMKNLKTVIIDLYDYTLFNIDVSLTKYADTYFIEGGYCFRTMC